MEPPSNGSLSRSKQSTFRIAAAAEIHRKDYLLKPQTQGHFLLFSNPSVAVVCVHFSLILTLFLQNPIEIMIVDVTDLVSSYYGKNIMSSLKFGVIQEQYDTGLGLIELKGTVVPWGRRVIC